MKNRLRLTAVVIAAGLHLLIGSTSAASLRVVVDAMPPGGLPVEISGELVAALTNGDAASATNLQFIVSGPRRRCVSQALAGTRAESHLLWKPLGAGKYEITARPATDEPSEPGKGEAPIARVERDTIHINNGVFSAAHAPNLVGGFPAAIVVAGAKTPLPIDYADRLYQQDVGQFSFATNPKPAVRLVANGPLFATVEVSGGYYRTEAGQFVQHESQPVARYRFTYFRNSPFVQVNAVVSQARAFGWKELHVLELRARPESLMPPADEAPSAAMPLAKSWAGGEPSAEGMVSHTNRTWQFSRWAALYFDNGVVAVMNPHATSDGSKQARIHDGTNLLYVMGPWVEFTGPQVEFDRYLYIGPRNVPRQALDDLASQVDCWKPLRVESPELETQAHSLRKAVATALPGLGNRTPRAVQLWRLNHALADLHSLQRVAAARSVLAQPPLKRTLPRETPPAVELISLGDGRDAVVTDQLLLVLDTKGRLTSFYQALTDTELLSRPCSMFRFIARNPLGVEATLTANETERASADFSNGELRLRYTGSFFGTIPAHVDLVLRPDGPSIHWRAEAAVDGDGAAAWRLDFPVLDGVGRLEGDDGEDAVIVPDGWGRLLPRPSVARYQSRYPGGGATMQCVGYARGETTLGVIARDGRCFVKDLVALGNEETRTVSLEARHYPGDMGFTRGCNWPYEVETVALAGDWFALAEHYRTWATRQAWCEGGKNRRRPDSPDWFRKLVWWHHDGVRDGAKLTDTFDRLRKAVPFPMAFHWYNWHSIPFDNFYPDYFPVNDYVPAVRAKMREWGVRVMPYINGHLWDTQAKSYTEEGAVRWAMKKFDGSLYIEHWNKHDHSTACPFTDAWRDKMVHVTDRLFRDVGVDAVYLDQIGAAAAQLCYDGSHGHARGGGDHYVAGYWKVLQAVRANARSLNPNAALTTEDTAEPYIRYLDGMLMCNRALPDSIPFFPAVYHDYVAQFGLYIYEPEIKAGVTFRSKEAMLFQFGGQLGWNGTNWSDAPEHREKFVWLAKLAAFRQAGLDWLGYGDMLRPPRVTMMRNGAPVPWIVERWTRCKSEIATEQPAVTASAWQASDGRVAVFVINVSDKPLNVGVQWPPEAKGRKIREMDSSGKETGNADIFNRHLRLDLAPQSVRMFVAM
ncbi:MAG: DUF6259 domain-containing protein [Verrucomicrobia bacterium]|nr:DUF6259 domain-containing protein [Verrucomicrobiota bacterium]